MKVKIVAVLFLALGGCMADPSSPSTAPPTETSLQQQMSDDSLYMLDVHEKAGNPLGSSKIDLSDPRQYHFVITRLAAAGKTIENSPELFSRLQISRDRAVVTANKGTITSLAPTDWCAATIHLGSEHQVGAMIEYRNAHPEVSCVGGAIYVYADITTYNSNATGTENFVVQSAAGEDYSGGTKFTAVKISPQLPAIVGRVNKTDSLVIAYDAYGAEQLTYSYITSYVVPIPSSITIAHPVVHSWIQNGGNIQMCQLRGSPDQCDYGVGSLTSGTFNGWKANSNNVYTGIAAVKSGTGVNGVPWAGDVNAYFPFTTTYIPNDLGHLYLPALGIVDAGATTNNCIIQSINFATFRLMKTVSGGTCVTKTSFQQSFSIPTNSRTAVFNTILDFANNGGDPGTPGSTNCQLSQIVNEAVSPSLTIGMTANCGNGPIPRIASMSPNGGDPIPPHIYFLNSCFAKGTGIRRADGSLVAVEMIKAGDKVISNRKGAILTVVGTSHGGEVEPLVGLRDNKGHMLRLTSKHPVVKASGEVVFASAIQKHDRVMTDRGIASIVSATRIPYTGQVYNLKLGTSEEQAKVGKNGTTLFAGGFLVGDSTMQQDHERPHHQVAQLSEVWARDYQNAVANNPPMKRILQ